MSTSPRIFGMTAGQTSAGGGQNEAGLGQWAACLSQAAARLVEFSDEIRAPSMTEKNVAPLRDWANEMRFGMKKGPDIAVRPLGS